MASTGQPLVQYAGGPFSGGLALADDTTAAAGRGILITASVAGTVTLLMADTTTVVVTVAVGDNIYPFSVTKATVIGATVTRMYNLM